MMIPRQEIRPSNKGERSLPHVLGRITALQREWNALSDTERASIAKESCDLTRFFRRGLSQPVDRRDQRRPRTELQRLHDGCGASGQ
jgi:hypothetical protein